jgi:phosphatidylserine decarboxylase
MLTKYGLDNIIIMLIISVILILISVFLLKGWLAILVGSLGILLALFTLWFFRDPERTIPPEVLNNYNLVISPADGKVVEIKKVTESKYLKSEAIQISIFLSPLDVHVNRSPVTGIVKYYNYVPGDYLVAFHPKSSELNEQSNIGVETDFGKVFFKQITGILARRLVCVVNVGDTLKAGERIGMMKFGSRMDIMVNTNTELFVKVGDKVIAGETIIAKLMK